MTINKKQLTNLVSLALLAGRYKELENFEGYVPSSSLSRRKGILKKQIRSLNKSFRSNEEQEETVIKFEIEVPEVETKRSEKKEKSLRFNLKDLFKKDVLLEEEDNDVFEIISKIVPEENNEVIGKIVREL
jgi:hypothetical protein